MLTKEEFKLDKPAKWCPGCGNHAILSAMQSALPEITDKPENVVFISGIGCSSRFPYYINTYGFHTLHGRALPVATGVKLANPKLNVWIATGDGDLLAIGGNHFIHMLRRNININILLFNNNIYALTKGQFSPTSPRGAITKSSPSGTLENAFNPAELAIGANCSFFARTMDNDIAMMKEIFIKASKHPGTSLIEIIQNCVIFNNKSYSVLYDKEKRADNLLRLEEGKPMLFGKNLEKGMIYKNGKLRVVDAKGKRSDKILIHQPDKDNITLQLSLGAMNLPDFPLAVGIIRSVNQPVFDKLFTKGDKVKEQKVNKNSIKKLLNSGNVFTIK